jgi:CheY-like chemotaxis protein
MAARRLRVLLAEKRLSETGIILRSICAEAGWALELVFVGTREALQEALRTHHPDLVLLDLALVQPDATANVHRLHLENEQIPLVVFGQAAEKACAEECLSRGARDYLLKGFMDERTVGRVLQATVADMGVKDWRNREDSKAGETCLCSLQAEVPEGTVQQPVATMVLQKQEELVCVLKRNVRAGDRIVPRWCGQIELVLSDANERCIEKVVQRLRTRMGLSEAGLSSDAPFFITVVSGDGVKVAQPLRRKALQGFALEIGERL